MGHARGTAADVIEADGGTCHDGVMERVPAELALLLLRQSGYNISGSTLRSWVHRKHINRYPDGYDLVEIVEYIERREGASPKQADGST
jgi:hypothetical protein